MTPDPSTPDGPDAPGIDSEPSRPDPTRPPEKPTERYHATVRLIRSRLADGERNRSLPWWKFRS